MRNRKKILTIAGVVLMAAGLTAGLVLAQGADETEAASSAASDTPLAKVAGILGIEESALVDAFEQVRLEGIDAAVVAGTLTEEQAEAMKASIEARSTLQDVIDNAIASGELTEEQAELLRERASNRSPVGGRSSGLRGRMQRDCGDSEDAGGFGFMLRTPRGGVSGGIWGHRR